MNEVNLVNTVFFQEAGAPIVPGIDAAAQTLAGNWQILVIGIVLIIVAVAIFTFIKKIIVNSVLGVVAWAILVFVFKVELQFVPTFVISVIFGLAGIGVILVLKFLNIAI